MKVAFYAKTLETVNKIRIMCLNQNLWTIDLKFISMELKAILKIENDTVFISFSVSFQKWTKKKSIRAANIFQQGEFK